MAFTEIHGNSPRDDGSDNSSYDSIDLGPTVYCGSCNCVQCMLYDEADRNPNEWFHEGHPRHLRAIVLQGQCIPPPDKLWLDILGTEALNGGEVMAPQDPHGSTFYFRLPLRHPIPACYRPWRSSHYSNGVETPDRDWTVWPEEVAAGLSKRGYHTTNITNLVRRCGAAPGSQGLLRERHPLHRQCKGGVVCGTSTHRNHTGFFFCTYWPGERWCPKHSDNVILEVDILESSRVKGGSQCRSCADGPPGMLSDKVTLKAIIVPLVDVPSCVILA